MAEVVWLVDIGYVVKASANLFKLDYVRAERFLSEQLGPVQTYLFNGYDPDYGVDPGLQAFYDAMERRHMQVRLHPMKPGPPGSNRQRRVDVDICAHMVWQASLPATRAVVLTSGDEDFIQAVELIRERLGKQVILFSYSAAVDRELVQRANRWWKFDDHPASLAR